MAELTYCGLHGPELSAVDAKAVQLYLPSRPVTGDIHSTVKWACQLLSMRFNRLIVALARSGQLFVNWIGKEKVVEDNTVSLSLTRTNYFSSSAQASTNQEQ